MNHRGRRRSYGQKHSTANKAANNLRGHRREVNLKELGLWHLRYENRVGGIPNTVTRAIIMMPAKQRQTVVQKLRDGASIKIKGTKVEAAA